MRKLNTRKKYIGCIAASLILLSVLLLFLGQTIKKYSNGIYQNIRQSTTESVEALTSDRVKVLDKTLNLLEVQAQGLAVYLSSPELTITPKLLQAFSDMDDDYLYITAFDAKGDTISSDEMQESLSVEDEVYRQVFAGKSGVTDTFMGNMGYEELRVYAPIYHGTEIVGGVFINLDAEILRSGGKSPLYDSAGYSYILKQDGTILLAPATYSYAQIYHNIQDVFSFSENSQGTVDAFMKAIESGKQGNVVLDFSGEKQIICFQPSTEKEGWYYVSVLPLSLVEKNGQTVIRLSSRIITFFIVIILAFLMFVAMVLSLLLRDKWKKDINEGRVYKAISENIDTAIFIMDCNTHYIRHVFDNIHNILGISAKEIQGKVFGSEFLQQAGLPKEAADMVREVRDSLQPAAAELKHYNPVQAKEVWLSVTVSPLNLKGRSEYMFAFTDITENKRLMEQLHTSMLEAQSANEAKSGFLANMSHDIRTPMNAIVGMTDIAILNIEDRDRVLDCLHKINLSSRHLKGLINDILDMSKIESGKLLLNPGVTSLPEVLEGIFNIIQFQADEKNQHLQVLVKQVKHETVLCDAIRFNQVLMNITANAVKFTPEGGSIRVTIEEAISGQGPEYGRYIFSIQDSGIGMSREFQKTMFQSFSRERSSHVEKTEGSGLGMAISKWIVDQMGGTIHVISEPGKGSEFMITIDFPLSAEKKESSALPKGLSLLLADTDPQTRNHISFILEQLGFQVDGVSDVEEALTHLAQERKPERGYDVILLYTTASDAAFFDSIGRIRTAAKHALLLAAAGDFQIEEQATANGADGVLSPLLLQSTVSSGLARFLIQEEKGIGVRPASSLMKGYRILLAEDNELNREIAMELLISGGAKVDTAENGQQCLEKFLSSKEGYYQMILMDIRMPVMDGYASARRIRSSGRADGAQIPILAVTADAFTEDIKAASDAGMNGHIAKPLDRNQVQEEIKKWLTNTEIHEEEMI